MPVAPQPRMLPWWVASTWLPVWPSRVAWQPQAPLLLPLVVQLQQLLPQQAVRTRAGLAICCKGGLVCPSCQVWAAWLLLLGSCCCSAVRWLGIGWDGHACLQACWAGEGRLSHAGQHLLLPGL